MYEVIVLGATFAAAGIAQRYKEQCLILEQSQQAGGEFFGALHFDLGYTEPPKNSDALSLWKNYSDGSIFDRCRDIYPLLRQAKVLFDAQLVSVEQTKEGYACVTYGVEGFCTHWAKQVIDTRSTDAMASAKTYNLLIDSKEPPAFEGICGEEIGGKGLYVLYLPVPLSCSYAEARSAAKKVILGFSETQKLILLASEFDYQIPEDYPKMNAGIRCLPSKAYKHPALAFEAGLEVAL